MQSAGYLQVAAMFQLLPCPFGVGGLKGERIGGGRFIGDDSQGTLPSVGGKPSAEKQQQAMAGGEQGECAIQRNAKGRRRLPKVASVWRPTGTEVVAG